MEAHLVGTKIQEWVWSRRHIYKGKEWIKGYWDAKDHPRCQLLSQKIEKFLPLKNIMEIGCNAGPNLYWLAKKYPEVILVGIDINPVAISNGMMLLKKEGIHNVVMEIGKAGDLNKYPDNSFDIVFTNATLIYIGPDKINKVIKEMIRVARKALILIEWHSGQPDSDPYGLGIYNYGGWKRNYENLLKPYRRVKEISIHKNDCFKLMGKDWEELGYIIEITL
jgi:ubiquinone/menaquinone biosynthesis C-methylase UbiE